MIGKSLGHYRIEQQIGAGGMGVVYRAHDDRLDRDVALKVLPQNLLGAPAATERLRQEALALSRLNHPNIAHVYDFDTQDGVSFLIMEFVTGDTLAQKLASGPISEEAAISIGIQASSALEDAAEAGIVQRDIKPSNIMWTPKGQVKVLDFGLAKLFRSADPDATRSHTDLPDAAGTLAYMAPERLSDVPADFRSDVYSLGSVLYESVAGKRPFVAKDSVTLISEILKKTPPALREINTTVSAGFESAVMRCLAKEPARRYQRASELRAALESIQDSHSGAVAVARSSNSRGRRAVAIGLLVTAVAAAIALIWRMPKRTGSLAGDEALPSELVILPVSGTDNDTTAFGNGLVETLTTRLTQLSQDHNLQVVPASDVREKKVKSLADASREFGATLGLTLDVERAGDEIRVNYTLADAKQHKSLRAGMITKAAADPFALEDSVADSVVTALQIQLTPSEKSALVAHGTAKPGAYDFYLRGRGYLDDFQEVKNVEAAISEFNHALEEDPNFAQAYAGLGEAYWRKYRDTADTAWVANAKSACERAVALRSEEAAGHDCLGMVYNGTGEFQNAVNEYQRATDLQPTDYAAFRGLSVAYEHLKQNGAAEELMKKAISLRPDYWSNYNDLGGLYRREGRYSEAESQFSEVIRLVPDSWVGYGNLGAIYLGEGQLSKALPLLEQSVQIKADSDNTSNLAYSYFAMRRYADAARIFEEAATLNPNRYEIVGNLGDAYYWAPGLRAKSYPVYRRASELARGHLRVNPNDADALAYLAGYEAALGEASSAKHDIARAMELAPTDNDVLFDAAIVYNMLAMQDRALDCLERVVSAGYSRESLLDSPDLDNLHGNSRFKQLVEAGPKR
jgi:serine/threonine-protein kinase